MATATSIEVATADPEVTMSNDTMSNTTSNDTIVISSTSAPAEAALKTGPAGRSVLVPGVLASLAAAAVTTAIAAVASDAGVSFADRTGSAIPLPGFAMLTVLFALLGVALAAVLRRRAARPRTAFVRTTVVLLALSFVPDLTSGFAASATATLILTHLAAAAVMIPALAVRLAPRR